MPMPEKATRDLMRRALYNLRYVELTSDSEAQEQLLLGKDSEFNSVVKKWRPSGHVMPPFEFTQLISTFLLAMVHPWETYYNKAFENWTLEDADIAWDLPRIMRKRNGRDVSDQNLAGLLGFFRNSIAHANMRLSPDNTNQIWLVELWNIPYYPKNTPVPPQSRWTFASVTTTTLRNFLLSFIRMTEELMKDNGVAARARVAAATAPTSAAIA